MASTVAVIVVRSPSIVFVCAAAEVITSGESEHARTNAVVRDIQVPPFLK
jgi:hypothetical protein